MVSRRSDPAECDVTHAGDVVYLSHERRGGVCAEAPNVHRDVEVALTHVCRQGDVHAVDLRVVENLPGDRGE